MYDFKERLERLDSLTQQAFEHETAIAELQHRMVSHRSALDVITKERDAIREEMMKEMLSDGCLEHKGDGVTYKLRKMPQRLEVHCKSEELPEQYQRIKVEADKVKLKADYKNGVASNYCSLSDVEYKLDIVHG